MTKHIHTNERAHMYTYVPSLFIVTIVGSLIFDVFFPYPIFATGGVVEIGLGLLLAGTFLLYTARRSAEKIRHAVRSGESEVNFFVGPYAYVRHPGYIGMVCIGVAFSFILNSLSIFVASVCFYFIARWFAIQEEKHLSHENSHVRHEYVGYTKKVKRYF